MSSNIPRRAYVERLTPAETAIRNAILEVESLGADVRLTDAVILLQAAKDSVGDYVDGDLYSEECQYKVWNLGMSSNVLTPEEEEIIREQSKRCSLDTKQLLAIIQRLVKLVEELSCSI